MYTEIGDLSNEIFVKSEENWEGKPDKIVNKIMDNNQSKNISSKNDVSIISMIINKTSETGRKEMNKKIIVIIILILLLIVGGVWLFLKQKNQKEPIEYTAQEEISDEQLRQTIVSLYFKNKNTSELVPEGRLIDVKLLLNEPYKTLMELLIEGPKNEKLEKLIPDGTKINNIELKNDILYIDLSKEFIENHQGGEELESNTIYSIVNTMTVLTEVNGVKILIDGKENQAFKDGKIKFDDAFVEKED